MARMTFKQFLLESKLKAYFIAICANNEYKKSFNDDIIMSLIGNKDRLSNINGNYMLKSIESDSVPYIVIDSKNKLKPIHHTNILEKFNTSLDTNNSLDDKANDFRISQLEKHIKIFGSVDSAIIYFNKNRKEILQKFKKTSRKYAHYVIIVGINYADSTFEIADTLNVAPEEILPNGPETEKEAV